MAHQTLLFLPVQYLMCHTFWFGFSQLASHYSINHYFRSHLCFESSLEFFRVLEPKDGHIPHFPCLEELKPATLRDSGKLSMVYAGIWEEDSGCWVFSWTFPLFSFPFFFLLPHPPPPPPPFPSPSLSSSLTSSSETQDQQMVLKTSLSTGQMYLTLSQRF